MESSFPATAMSVTEAIGRGTALFRDAAEGQDIVVSRHGRPVAAIVSVERLEALRSREADVRSANVMLTRLLSDDGVRHDLDDVIGQLGFNRADLETDMAAARD